MYFIFLYLTATRENKFVKTLTTHVGCKKSTCFYGYDSTGTGIVSRSPNHAELCVPLTKRAHTLGGLPQYPTNWTFSSKLQKSLKSALISLRSSCLILSLEGFFPLFSFLLYLGISMRTQFLEGMGLRFKN